VVRFVDLRAFVEGGVADVVAGGVADVVAGGVADVVAGRVADVVAGDNPGSTKIGGSNRTSSL
jgi:hypothetical protein